MMRRAMCIGSLAFVVLLAAAAGQAEQGDPRFPVVNENGEVIMVLDAHGNVVAARRPDGSMIGDPAALVQPTPVPVATARRWQVDPAPGIGVVDERTRLVQQPNPARCVVIDEHGEARPLENCVPTAAQSAAADPAPAAANPTIDVMTTSFSYGSWSPGGQFGLLGSASVYSLSNGTTWYSGAGSYRTSQSSLNRVEVAGTTVRYLFAPPVDGILYQQTDYDSGDHSAQGTLGVAGDLVLEATVGARTATLHGLARLLSNDATYYGEPRFNYYTALVGSIVPFDLTVTLQSGTWSASTFSGSFSYSSTGRVNFASPVSVPALASLVIAGSAQVPENSTVAYFAVATFEGGITRTVTEAASWSVEPASLASVSAGLLTSAAIDGPRAGVTLRATYAQGGVQRTAEKGVTIVDAGAILSEGSWPTFQANPAHTGHVAAILEPETFSLRWTRAVAAGRALNPVSGGDGRVFVSVLTYFGGGQGLFALDARDGEILWSKEFGSVFSVNPPAYAYGNVYIQSGNHSTDTWLHAFDGATGERVFKSPHAAQWERYYAPTVVDGAVYVDGGYYGGMYAFDAFSGTQRWFRGLPQYDQWTPAVDGSRAYAYVGEYSPGLYVLDRATGNPVYTIADPHFDWNGWSMNLAPVLGGNDDAIAIHDGRLISFDLAGRRIRWEIDGGFTGQPAVAHGTLYAIAGGRLLALDERTGATVWSWEAPEGGLTGPMIVTESHALVCSATRVHAVDLLTRSDAWSYAASGQLSLANDTLYVASANGTLTAIAMATISPARLVRLEIDGPAQVPEFSLAQYQALAYYDDGRVRSRSLVSQWTISPTTSAALDADGTLTTTELFTPSETIHIGATYAERGVTVDADRAVTLVIGVPLDDFIARNMEGAVTLENEALASLAMARYRKSAAAAVLLDQRGDGAQGDPSHIHALDRLTQSTHWGLMAKTEITRSLEALQAALLALAGLDGTAMIPRTIRTEPAPTAPEGLPPAD